MPVPRLLSKEKRDSRVYDGQKQLKSG